MGARCSDCLGYVASLFIRNDQTVFQNVCTSLHWMRVPTALHSCQHPVFWILAILVDIYWYPIVVLISISLMTYEVEHLSIWLFAVYIPSSLVRCLLGCLAHLIIRFSVFLLLSSLYILYKSLSDMSSANIFSHLVSFHSPDIIFHRAEVFWVFFFFSRGF